jgi:ribosome-associated protein
MNEFTTDTESAEVSKSQRKRDAQELLDLARQLIAMPANQLDNLPIDNELRDAIDFAQGIRSHGARKRQLMTVGKMMRQRDNQELLDAIQQIDQKNRRESARFHHLEAWREQLVNGNDDDLTRLLENSGSANVQTLRQLIRNAKKEARLNKPPTSARKLFRLLREMDADNPLPPL